MRLRLILKLVVWLQPDKSRQQHVAICLTALLSQGALCHSRGGGQAHEATVSHRGCYTSPALLLTQGQLFEDLNGCTSSANCGAPHTEVAAHRIDAPQDNIVAAGWFHIDDGDCAVQRGGPTLAL